MNLKNKTETIKAEHGGKTSWKNIGTCDWSLRRGLEEQMSKKYLKK